MVNYLSSSLIKALSPEDLTAMRIEIEGRLRKAEREEAVAKRNREAIGGELQHIQRFCPHANVTIDTSRGSDAWQGGGMYFTRSHCTDCNKKGDRYSREITIRETRKWDTTWGRDKGAKHYEEVTPKKSGILFGEYDW